MNMTPQYVKVKSLSQRRDGGYRRAGMQFGKADRILQVVSDEECPVDGETRVVDDNGKISLAILDRLNADEMLNVKELSAKEAELAAQEIHAANTDPQALIEALQAQVRALEARIIKTEKTTDQGKGKG